MAVNTELLKAAEGGDSLFRGERRRPEREKQKLMVTEREGGGNEIESGCPQPPLSVL